MPRVLRILNRLTIGGPLLNAAYLTKYLAPEFETMLLVGDREQHETDAAFVTDGLGIRPVYVPEMGRSIDPRRDYLAYKKVQAIIRSFQPDIVHTHAAKPGAVGRMAARACKVPVVVHTYHGHVFHSYFNKAKTRFILSAERYLGRLSDAIIAISEAQRQELAVDFRIAPEAKFHVVPLGLDLDKFQHGQTEKRRQFRQEFGVGDDTVVVSIIGRLVPVKNHGLFLAGLRQVLAGSKRHVKAFIIGDGETRSQLEAQASALGIAFSTQQDSAHGHPLVFTSWRSDVDRIMAGSDIIALTSLNEGTPVSLIEAQAANRPVVSTRVGGIADIVAEGHTGLLSDVQDVQGFAANLLALVENEALRQRLGNNGAAHVMQRFSYQRLVRDMSALYQQLLNQQKP
ncbi:MAG TPA: glycosyltransferase [Chitinophagaceae bacterium]|nr:glycosyltransferase [Chitinophagaceae bacterium]